MIDPLTPGYDRWCEAAKRAHGADWSMATSETREPWIAEARQKEVDANAERVSHTRAIAPGDGSKLTSGRQDGPKVAK